MFKVGRDLRDPLVQGPKLMQTGAEQLRENGEWE